MGAVVTEACGVAAVIRHSLEDKEEDKGQDKDRGNPKAKVRSEAREAMARPEGRVDPGGPEAAEALHLHRRPRTTTTTTGGSKSCSDRL